MTTVVTEHIALDENNPTFSLAIKDTHGNWKRFYVEPQVYLYVRQLEEAIKQNNSNGLKQLYKERFKDG